MSSLVLTGDTSGQVTLAAPAVAGTNTITLAAQTGTLNAAGPAFSAYGSALQSISNTTLTKIAFNTKIFDTNNNYDSTTNYRFTPTVAGYYLITASIGWNGSATGYTSINIYKNGSNAFNGGYVSNSSVGPVVTASSIFLANGTTDYFEIYCAQSSGGALSGGSNGAPYTFSGCLIRGA